MPQRNTSDSDVKTGVVADLPAKQPKSISDAITPHLNQVLLVFTSLATVVSCYLTLLGLRDPETLQVMIPIFPTSEPRIQQEIVTVPAPYQVTELVPVTREVEVTRLVTSEPIVITQVIEASPLVDSTESPGEQQVGVIYEIGQTQRSWTNPIELIVQKVEILPNDTMKWYVDFWNRGTADIGVSIRNEQTYLADELGNRYEVLDDDLNNGPNGLFAVLVQPSVRISHYLLFRAPVGGANEFTVGIVNKCCDAGWKVFTVTLHTP